MSFTELKEKVARLRMYYDPQDPDYYFCIDSDDVLWMYNRGDCSWDRFDNANPRSIGLVSRFDEGLSRITPLSFMVLTGMNPRELFAFDTKGPLSTPNENRAIIAKLKQMPLVTPDKAPSAWDVSFFHKHLMSILPAEGQAVLAFLATDPTVYKSVYVKNLMIQLGHSAALYSRILGHVNPREKWREILVKKLHVVSDEEFLSLSDKKC